MTTKVYHTNVSESKAEYGDKLNRLLDSYDKILFCQIDNVKSQQLHQVRAALRKQDTVILVGKKTLQKRIINNRAESENATESDKALRDYLCESGKEMLVGNLALVFTNEDVAAITKTLLEYRIQAPAKLGSISPLDVTVPAGNTGLEPTMTSFFQALNIPTKIAKGTVEIVTDKKVLSTGDKVDASTAQLLKKLKISPFFYQAEVEFFFEKGLMFTAEDLAVTDASIEAQLSTGIANLTAASLGAGVVTDLSFPQLIMDGFKTLLGASVATDYEFSEFDGKNLRTAAKEGKLGGGGGGAAAAAPAAAAKGGAPAKKKEKTPEESEDDEEMMDLF